MSYVQVPRTNSFQAILNTGMFLPICGCVSELLLISVKFTVYTPVRITPSLPELPPENDVAFRCLENVIG